MIIGLLARCLAHKIYTIVVPNYVICPKYVRKLLAVDLSDPILNPGISKDTGRKIHPSPT